MKQNIRDRAPNNERQPAVAAKSSNRPTIVTCEKDHATADSEDPLGPQPALCKDQNLTESPPGEESRTPAEDIAGAEAATEPPGAANDPPIPASEPPGAAEIKPLTLAATQSLEPKGPSVAAPRRFKSYELLWEHSKDALSTTYAAKNGAVDQILTLRLFNARISDSLQIKEIQRAAQKASELTHLHLATVYESGIDETGAPYVVSDLVEGNNLAEVLQLTKRLDIARFLNIFNQVGEALIEAHSHELFHGNLSPEKIVLTPNEIDTDMVKLIDFGMPPDPVGNAFYLSPEQCIDKSKSEAKSDIYSLGCIMYEALVGTPPFVGSKQSQAALNYLHELANQFPKDSPEHNALKLLDCIIIKCLQKEPSKRFRNVRELMNSLRLVNDCICNGSSKKLPPKAEKLLIFRFLDLFGNKIAACMTAYLIFGFVCLRIIGEANLQKHIDQAALSATFNDQRARDNWISAIKQAEWLHKPPSFMAALHNNLGDAYAGLITGETITASSDEPWPHVTKINNEEKKHARDAIVEYQKAYDFYSKGHFYKSDSLALLSGMTAMWSKLETTGFSEDRHAAAIREVQKLWLAKKYSECASAAEKYLQYVPDKHLAFYAANANTEMALALPAAKALRYFERAAYYFAQSDAKLNFECDNLSICISRLGMNPESSDTRSALGRAAIERGDLQAAHAEYSRMQGFDSYMMADRIKELLSWKIHSSQTYEADPIMKESIKPLERMLVLEDEAGDKNSRAIWMTLSNLATNYRLCGEDKKAVDAYKRLVDMIPHSYTDQLAYVDQLVKVGRKADARSYLEKEIHKIDSHDINPLPIRLLKAYADDNMKQQVRDTLIKLIPYSEPQRSVWMGEYQYPALPLANRAYSRNGVIYTE